MKGPNLLLLMLPIATLAALLTACGGLSNEGEHCHSCRDSQPRCDGSLVCAQSLGHGEICFGSAESSCSTKGYQVEFSASRVSTRSITALEGTLRAR